MQRVVGTSVDPKIFQEEHRIMRRSGVELEDVEEALFAPISVSNVITRSDGLRSVVFWGSNCAVTVNPDTGQLIQTNPIGRK